MLSWESAPHNVRDGLADLSDAKAWAFGARAGSPEPKPEVLVRTPRLQKTAEFVLVHLGHFVHEVR